MAAADTATSLERRQRGARDRLLDLVLVGETAPLQDLAAWVEPPVVTFGGSTRLLVEDTQVGVAYEIRDEEGAPRRDAQGTAVDMPVEGNGGTVAFPLAGIEEEATFTVLARKLAGPGFGALSGRSAFLHARPAVRVGLATGLAAWIRPVPTEAPPLIDHRAAVDVEIEDSQEGVDYRLVHHPAAEPAEPADLASLDEDSVVSATPWTRGNGSNIVLSSQPLTADMLLRVRCLKTFEDGRQETNLLLRRLPVLVRADRTLEPVPRPDGPLAHGDTPALHFDPAERSVAYRVHLRPLREAEFRPGATGTGFLRIPVVGAPDVVISAPDWPADWPDPAGFSAPGTYSGTSGAPVDLPLPALADDTLVVVEARKIHNEAIAGAPTASTVALAAMLVFLVAPNPRPLLRLELAATAAGSTGPLTVHGGQPGVAYHFRVAPDGPDVPMAAYAHRRDEADPRLNKGLGQLWLGIDFVLAPDPIMDPGDIPRAARPPAPPRLDAPQLAFGSELLVTATKARTGVAAPIAPTVRLDAPPAVALLTPSIAPGTPARVQVTASRASETYTLQVGGAVPAAAVRGTGADLTLTSPPLDRSTSIDVLVTTADAALPVTWRFGFSVTVAPVRVPRSTPPGTSPDPA
jgi:hypothetical protein